MRATLTIISLIIVVTGMASAQEQRQPAQAQHGGVTPGQQSARRHDSTLQSKQRVRAGAAAKEQRVPSIIQSELDRSRAEENQQKSVRVQPAQIPPPAAPVWPLFVSLGIGAAATTGLLFFFLRRKSKATATAPRPQSEGLQQQQTPASVQQQPVMHTVYEPAESAGDGKFDEHDVHSASPYVNDDDTEMPEAALTMNLLNKKRETKKELIIEVMKRVQRRENPQHIAEALRIGVGEVHLAMTLAKLKK